MLTCANIIFIVSSYFCFRSNMAEALEWLLEQDDSDEEEDEEVDFLFTNTKIDASGAGPSTSTSTKKKTLKEACTELFEAGDFY